MNQTELSFFLGLCNVPRRFELNVSRVAIPRNKKLRPDQPTTFFSLMPTEKEAVGSLEKLLTNPPIVVLPHVPSHYAVDTDASPSNLEYMLLQQ